MIEVVKEASDFLQKKHGMLKKFSISEGTRQAACRYLSSPSSCLCVSKLAEHLSIFELFETKHQCRSNYFF